MLDIAQHVDQSLNVPNVQLKAIGVVSYDLPTQLVKHVYIVYICSAKMCLKTLDRAGR